MAEEMNDQEKAAHLIELHREQLEHFRQTRDLDLKINLALWALIALSGAFLYVMDVRLEGGLLFYYITTAASFYLGFLIVWTMPVQHSLDTDDHYINQYRKQVEALVGFRPEGPPDKTPARLWRLVTGMRPGGWSWMSAKTGIILLLLFGVYTLLTLPA